MEYSHHAAKLVGMIMIWKAVLDKRTRHIAKAFPTVDWDNVEPPIDLGMFNCRGDYVFRDGRKFTAEQMGCKPNY